MSLFKWLWPLSVATGRGISGRPEPSKGSPREGTWPREPDPRAPRPRNAPRLLEHLSRTLSGGVPRPPATERPAVTGLARDRGPARPAPPTSRGFPGLATRPGPSRPGCPARAPPRPARIVSARHTRPGLSLAELGGECLSVRWGGHPAGLGPSGAGLAPRPLELCPPGAPLLPAARTQG